MYVYTYVGACISPNVCLISNDVKLEPACLAQHQAMGALFAQLQASGLPLDTLSLGMSADLEAAIAAGSTMVRVGSAIFGARA